MKEKTIYALGFFDGVHIGHQALLKECRRLADTHGCKAGVVTFGNHPDGVVQGKTPSLINTLADRKRLLSQFHMDCILELPFDEHLRTMSWLDFLVMLSNCHNAIGFVCGSDFRFGHKGRGTAALLEEYCQLEWLPYAIIAEQQLEGTTVSSTCIRGLLEAGELPEANRFLGHPHILSGEVVSGRKLGRTLGIPTANISIPAGVVQLPFGVYACKACVDREEYIAVTNIGNRPTVGGHRVTVEPWLLDFDGDLYGKELTLSFYRFLRPEQKFPDLDALKEEIQKNALQARNFFENNAK